MDSTFAWLLLVGFGVPGVALYLLHRRLVDRAS
jgi:hypothetical protein